MTSQKNNVASGGSASPQKDVKVIEVGDEYFAPKVVLKPAYDRSFTEEEWSDAIDALKQAFKKAKEECIERGIDLRSEEFDNILHEYFHSFLEKTVSWDWEYYYAPDSLIAFDAITRIVDRFLNNQEKVNVEIELEWTRKKRYRIETENASRPGPSFDGETIEHLYTDGQKKLIKRNQEYNYPTYSGITELWEIHDFTWIVKTSHDYWEGTMGAPENWVHIISTQKETLRKLAERYRDYLNAKSKAFLKEIKDEIISIRVTQDLYNLWQVDQRKALLKLLLDTYRGDKKQIIKDLEKI